jgi:hypothetical protein
MIGPATHQLNHELRSGFVAAAAVVVADDLIDKS